MHLPSNSECRIEPFNPRWARTVLGWISNKEELRLWSGRSDFPLENPRVFEEWHADSSILPCLMHLADEPAAYGELWVDEIDHSTEVGRLLVSPRWRRRGLATSMVGHLVQASKTTGYDQIWVRAFPDNLAGIDCYLGAGFVRVSPDQEAVLNSDQRFQFIWLKLPASSGAGSL